MEPVRQWQICAAELRTEEAGRCWQMLADAGSCSHWGWGATPGYAENGVKDRARKWKAKLGRDLLISIEQKNVATVKACLEQQADPNLVDASGGSALHLAARLGDVQAPLSVLGFPRTNRGRGCRGSP
eukprot:Skav227511  [mRNA]  locus=scaffold282:285541:286578:+ [translate_table: standard]